MERLNATEEAAAGPSAPVEKNPQRIASMFDAIAARYDFLNHLLSGGLDLWWRARAIASLRLGPRDALLDLCTGTGDVAIAALRGAFGTRRAIGVDFSSEMLRYARGKLAERGLLRSMALVRGDATRIPLGDSSVDAVTVAFGIRNVERPEATCAEMLRVLRPEGRIAILEFGLPRLAAIRGAYLWYFRTVLPRVGRLISRHADAYSYLPRSVSVFAPPDLFAATLRAAGFADVHAVPLTFGVVYLYTATKR
jgi:demethylmenaquinone methyltransferase/2-methoxy-6-polyprenyl-1,4-benzoquinol methylase